MPPFFKEKEMSKITEALEKLDPSNDNHWTNDGLPRIETIRMLAGDQSITREAITAEAPNFSRQTAKLEPVVTEQKTEETSEVVEKDYPAMIAEGRQYLQDAITARDEAQARVNHIQNKLDELISEQQAFAPTESNADAIQSYLNSQKGVLNERARRAKVLKDSGVTLEDIKALIPQAAPIDQALAKKR